MRGLSFSKQAIIDYNTLKNNVATNQAVFILINKDDKEVMRIMNTSAEVEKEIKNIQGHFKYGQLAFDIIGFKEISDKLTFC